MPQFTPLNLQSIGNVMNNKKAIERLTRLGHSRFLVVEELRNNCVSNTLEKIIDLKKQIDDIDIEINSILINSNKEIK